jgi:hypothetical protein
MSIINEIIFYYLQERGGGASGLTLLLVVMSFGSNFDQPVPITTHRPIRKVMPYQQMHGNWHGLAEKATKTDLSW